MTLDEALDELYGAPLENFVAERKRLAKELGGEEGKELAALRKPNIAAWTLNQLARRERRDVDLLLDAGHRMRQAGVKKEAFEQARAKESDALRRLTKAATQLGASPQVVQKVGAALRAAAVTEEGRERLALGRFDDLPSASGFEAYEGIELPQRTPGKKARAQPQRRVGERREAATALRDAERRLHELERTADRAEKAARAARAEAEAAAEEVDAARRRVDELRQ